MREREKNIFYNVLKNETSLTEVMCNLMSYKAFRDLFIELVNTKRTEENRLKISMISYDDFSTEKDFGSDEEIDENNDTAKIGRGDLILDYDDKDVIFEIKVENFTRLTKNQPEGYLRYLKKQNKDEVTCNDKLYFILPKQYRHINEICQRWHKHNSHCQELIKDNHIIYWEDILDEIKRRELHRINPIIEAFCEILDNRWFFIKPFSFSSYEIGLIFEKYNNKNEELTMAFDTNIPKIMNKLCDIVLQVKIDTIRKEDQQCTEYFGYFVDHKKYGFSEKIYIFYGITYEVWEKSNSPLMIEVGVNEQYDDDGFEKKIAEKLELEPFTYEDNTLRYIKSIEKESFSDQKIVSLLQQKIEDIISKVKQIAPQSD
jgi:hypothetical protein